MNTNIKKVPEERRYLKIDKQYQEIYNLISRVPINTNEICKKSKKSIGEVNMALTMLELQGAIRQVGINEFILV